MSFSFIILFKFIVNYLEIENKWVKFLVLLSVYTIILNHMSIEYLLYPESCVMCASMLLCIIATKTYLNREKGSLIKAFILLLFATLCYQGLISIFPTLVIVLGFLKASKGNKETFKFYIKEVFKVGIMFVIAMLISAILVFVFNNILQDSSNRLERIDNMFNLLRQIPGASFDLLLRQTNKIPKNLTVIVMCITTIFILIYNKNLELLFKYILSIFTAYVFSMVPIAIYGYITSRILMSIGATMGISLLFITVLLNNKEDSISVKKVKTILISIGVIVYFAFNIVNNYIAGYEHLKAFKIDEEIGEKISNVVKNYEATQGKEVTKIAFCSDRSLQGYETGVQELGSLTERNFAMRWCITESITYYCNNDLKEIGFSSNVYNKYFKDKDFTEFSEEQFVFIEDTMYMCVY